MSKYQEYVIKKFNEYGDKFDPSDLAKNFVPYFISGDRIEVKFSYGEIKRGRVGVTTGWKPCFILMLRTSDRGSSWTLSDKDEIIKTIK